jgi:Fic family protein
MPCDDDLDRRYPHIQFRKHWELSPETNYLLGACDGIVSAICDTPMQPDHRRQLLNVSLVKGAQATTAIEGNTLTDAEVQKVSVGGSLPPSKEYQEREVRNILDAMDAILKEVARDGQTPLISQELIRSFHKRVGKELGEHFDAIPGQFRTDERFVGPYKCPRAQDIKDLIDCLCDWLPREFVFSSGKQTFSQAVVQAIVTHVYVEWIHPFGDGNGRTGRLLEFYILLRGGNPDIASHILSNHYNETRAEYYRQLDQASKNRDLSAFLTYAIQGYYDGLQATLEKVVGFTMETAWRHLIYAKFGERPIRKESVHKRRRSVALAVHPTEAMSPDQIMMLTPDVARRYARLTPRTLERDIDELVEMEILDRVEDGKYRANLGLLGAHLPLHRPRHKAAKK